MLVRLKVLGVTVAAVAGFFAVSGVANAAGNVVISQIYGGGGNSGAQYQNDYVEVFNRSNALADVGGWSVQYTCATGTGNFGSATNLLTPLTLPGGHLFIAPGQYLLVAEAQGSTGASSNPDVT